jgi:Helicase associated domain
MSNARRQQLDAIEFNWDPHDDAWEKGFAALKQFKAREKHCQVPRGHQEGAFNLGTWVVNQRNRRGTLSVQRRQRLDAIDFVWRLK